MTGSLVASIIWFAGATIVITLFGPLLSKVVDRLADRTGLGEAIAGAVILGASTSLPGSIASVTAAWNGHPSLAVSNAIGGIAVQTAFLAAADLATRANLEHAAASLGNLFSAAILMLLLAGVLIAGDTPPVTLLGVHPATPLLAITYLAGLFIIRRGGQRPYWKPVRTRETREDVPEETPSDESLSGLWGRFALYAGVTAVAGWVVGTTGIFIADVTGLGESIVGALFTAVATSTPELVTSIAAVRRGSLVLAVSGIVGGNTFDVMFTVFSDIAYRPGSIYHAMARQDRFLIELAIAMTAVVLLAMLYRQKKGLIGVDGIVLLILYVGGMLMFANLAT